MWGGWQGRKTGTAEAHCLLTSYHMSQVTALNLWNLMFILLCFGLILF